MNPPSRIVNAESLKTGDRLLINGAETRVVGISIEGDKFKFHLAPTPPNHPPFILVSRYSLVRRINND